MDTDATTGSDAGAPKKYIRTLAGDMDTFQKGGVPDLALMKETFPAPAPVPAPDAPKPPLPILDPVFPRISIPELEKQSPMFATISQKPDEAPIAPPIVPAVPVAAEKPIEKEETGPVPLKTYANDFSARMEETHATTATVLAAEQDAGPRPQPVVLTEEPVQNVLNKFYVIGGITLLLLSLIGIVIAYSRYASTTAPVAVAPAAQTPIFVDTSETVSGKGTALQQAIKQLLTKPLAANTVRLLTLDTTTATDMTVFAALQARVPGILLRNIDPAGSMAGIVDVNSTESPFFILSVASYSATFSGMLTWESVMQGDLATLYPLYPAPAATTPAVATTTATATTTASAKAIAAATATATATAATAAKSVKVGFRDEVVSNHDVRVYRDALNRSILLYGYWNQTTLVIARDPSAFTEILGRLATSHAQ